MGVSRTLWERNLFKLKRIFRVSEEASRSSGDLLMLLSFFQRGMTLCVCLWMHVFFTGGEKKGGFRPSPESLTLHRHCSQCLLASEKWTLVAMFCSKDGILTA